jgi:hypothetical protein
MVLTISTWKGRDLGREASQLFRKAQCSVRHLSSFIDKAQAMIAAVFPARLQTRALLSTENAALPQGLSWISTIPISPTALEELNCCISNFSPGTVRGFYHQYRHMKCSRMRPTKFEGLSTTIPSDGMNERIRNFRSINYKEQLVILKTLQIPQLRATSMRIYCDNMTMIAYANKFGRTRSDPLSDLARQI